MGKKKKIKPGIIELHPTEPMIIVNYEMQIEYTDNEGNSHMSEKQESKKKIKIKTFNANSNIPKAAKGIIEHCKYIPSSKEQQIIALLQQLKKRITNTHPSIEEDTKYKELQMKLEREINLRLQKEKELKQERDRVNEARIMKQKLLKQRQSQIQKEKESKKLLEAKALLEKEEAKKLREAKKRLEKKEKKKLKKLMKQQLKIEKEMEKNMPKDKATIDKLEKYIENLYENDVKIKIAATYHILQLVQEPEYLSEFVENKALIGALGRMLHEDRKKNNELISNILEIFFCFSNFSDLHSILINSKIGATTMQIISYENKRYELTLSERKKNSLNQSISNLDENEMKFVILLHRQEKLFYICFYVLLNLAEDIKIETKMVQLGIVKYLMKTLQRKNAFRTWLDELLILLLTFAKKLSLFVENKNKMIEMGIVSLLFNIINISAETARSDIELAVIRLLFNLSFDMKCKQQICECGLLQWLVQCLHKAHAQEYAVKCLYNLSIIEEFKSQICYTETVVIITEMIIDFGDRLIPSEIMALAINLSTFDRAIEIIILNNDYLSLLIKRVHRTFDPLLMKMIHNLSCSANESIKIKFKRHLHQLLGMTKTCESRDFLVEVLGTISNLSYHGTTEIVAYHELITQYNLLDFFTKLLSHTLIEDDLLIGIIMVIGCFSATSKSCALFGEPRLLRALVQHIRAKLFDEEIALQSIYTIFKLLLHQNSREYVCRESQFISIIQQLANDKNAQIKMFAELCLDIIVNYGDEWIESIREKRFEQHNYEWIQFIESLTEEEQISPLSPIALTHTKGGKDYLSDDLDDLHSSLQLQNMFLISDDEEEQEMNDENSGIIHNMQRLAMFNN